MAANSSIEEENKAAKGEGMKLDALKKAWALVGNMDERSPEKVEGFEPEFSLEIP